MVCQSVLSICHTRAPCSSPRREVTLFDRNTRVTTVRPNTALVRSWVTICVANYHQTKPLLLHIAERLLYDQTLSDFPFPALAVHSLLVSNYICRCYYYHTLVTSEACSRTSSYCLVVSYMLKACTQRTNWQFSSVQLRRHVHAFRLPIIFIIAC